MPYQENRSKWKLGLGLAVKLRLPLFFKNIGSEQGNKGEDEKLKALELEYGIQRIPRAQEKEN